MRSWLTRGRHVIRNVGVGKGLLDQGPPAVHIVIPLGVLRPLLSMAEPCLRLTAPVHFVEGGGPGHCLPILHGPQKMIAPPHEGHDLVGHPHKALF